MNAKENFEDREDLKKWLRRGDLQRIAAACEVDRDTVYRWFAGAENPAIELVVTKTVELRKQQAMDAAEKIVSQ